MTDQEYKEYIMNNACKLIRDNCISIKQEFVDNKLCLRIVNTNPEWYIVLDNTVKYDIENILYNHFKPLILEALHNSNLINDGLERGSKRQKLF